MARTGWTSIRSASHEPSNLEHIVPKRISISCLRRSHSALIVSSTSPVWHGPWKALSRQSSVGQVYGLWRGTSRSQNVALPVPHLQ